LSDYIAAIEQAVGVKAKLDPQPMQPGDLPATAADTRDLEAWIGFRPDTPIAVGVERFVAWYRQFYGV
jgi:UDP-glucuronate 4-epimerase